MLASQTRVESRSRQVAHETAVLSRPLFIAALVVIGFANGISEKVYRSVADYGLAGAISTTFDISLILWGACIAAVAMLLRAPAEPIRSSDYVVGALVASTFLVPVPALSWVGLCVIAVYMRATAPDATTQRAAAIVFALTLPLFWSRLLFAAFSDAILRLDAVLIGWIVGASTTGNVVPLADGSGSMFIAPGCSSVANLALVILSATTFVNVRSGHWSRSTLVWTAACIAAVVAINLVRISLIAVYPEQFELIHGPIGASIAGCLTLLVIVSFGYQKIGYDAPVNR